MSEDKHSALTITPEQFTETIEFTDAPAGLAAPMPAELPAGARVLNEARAFVARFWAPSSDAALDLLVLWAAGTHACDGDNRMVFETYPHLFLGSKTPASGKTTALKMLGLLAARAEMVSDPTAPALMALIDQERAALLLDEADTLAGGGGFGRSTRTILLESYKKSGSIVRGSSGANGGVKRTCVYAPVALAGMWQNWISNPKLDALRTRTFMIPCVARRAGQNLETFRRRVHQQQAVALNAGLAKWGRRSAQALAEAWPEVPEGMEDRDAELVEPLIAVAEAAGGDWPERARHAVKVLLRGEPEEDDDPTTPLEMLLADLGTVFMGADRLASRTIVGRLAELPGSPWRRYPSAQAAGKEIAAILAPLGIQPRPVKLDGLTVRGYDWADIEPHVPGAAAPEIEEFDDLGDIPW